MTTPRVLVVEHQNDAGLGLVGERLRSHAVELVTVGPDTGRTVPESLAGYDALVVLGGTMGPTDDAVAPWLPATRQLLAEGVERQVPTLGICLGAQLLATATGGVVRDMPAGPEVGLCSVEFANDADPDPVFGALAGLTVSTVQWHWLEAASLPAESTVLASSGACRNQAFRVGERAWGVQFHPEALTQTIIGWASEDRESLARLGIAENELVSQVRSAEPALTTLWGAVADRFAGVVTGASPAPADQPAAVSA